MSIEYKYKRKMLTVLIVFNLYLWAQIKNERQGVRNGFIS